MTRFLTALMFLVSFNAVAGDDYFCNPKNGYSMCEIKSQKEASFITLDENAFINSKNELTQYAQKYCKIGFNTKVIFATTNQKMTFDCAPNNTDFTKKALPADDARNWCQLDIEGDLVFYRALKYVCNN